MLWFGKERRRAIEFRNRLSEEAGRWHSKSESALEELEQLHSFIASGCTVRPEGDRWKTMSNQDIARFYLKRSADLTRSRYMESIYEVLLNRVKNAISNYPWDMGLNGGGSGNLRFPDGTWPEEWMPPSEW